MGLLTPGSGSSFHQSVMTATVAGENPHDLAHVSGLRGMLAL